MKAENKFEPPSLASEIASMRGASIEEVKIIGPLPGLKEDSTKEDKWDRASKLILDVCRYAVIIGCIIVVIFFLILLFCGRARGDPDSIVISGTTNTYDARISFHTYLPARQYFNYGSETVLYIGEYEDSGCGRSYWDMIQFLFEADLSGIPADQQIDSAFFRAYCDARYKYSGCQFTDVKTYIHPFLRDWTEGTANAAIQTGSVCWRYRYTPSDTSLVCPDGTPPDTCWYSGGADSLGYDCEATFQDTHTLVAGSVSDWVSWEVTDAVQRWYAGSLTNNGFVMLCDWDSNDDYATTYEFRSSEYATASYHPKLVVYYTGEEEAGGGSTRLKKIKLLGQ